MLLHPNNIAFTRAQLQAPTAPLLSPLGDDWLATDCLSLKLTIRNQRKPLQGGVGEGFLSSI